MPQDSDYSTLIHLRLVFVFFLSFFPCSHSVLYSTISESFKLQSAITNMKKKKRFDDGEVVRYGAGESWRPTPRDRSPRRVRSPVRERARSPRPRSPRPRSPIPSGSDSYVPGRYPPRRRSRSGGDRYRRERSRERESPRRRERSRSMRRPSPRRSLSRRVSPPRGADRYERPRSPAPGRDWERDRERVRDREWDRDRVRDRGRDFERRDERRRSRSPFGVIRRDRTPPVRSPVTGPRGGSYRPRSRSMSRRGNDRWQSYRRVSPPRESGISSAITSQSASGRSSPRPSSVRARSPLQSREESPHHHAMSGAAPPREAPRPGPYDTNTSAPARSPPRGPAALRAPPTGPAANRNPAAPVSSPALPPPARTQTPTAPPLRSGTTSPTVPPAGPRGYVPPARGGFAPRGGRGGWNQAPARHISGPSPTPPTPSGPSAIPTGPRATPSNTSSASTTTQSRPFNPPTGPSAQHAGGARQTLAQSMLATLPPIIPGGKLDPSMTPLALGVTRELEPHYRKLKDEEEKLRDELHAKQERLRKSLYTWNRLERDSRAWEMRSDLSEKSMKSLAGEGMGGAAF
ncbi:hypothetical protein FOPG_06587 [Fusarium oxysporum f. sp. conglutinans race 2 54008]|uniref:Serine/arginine repetitive matrix protein 1 n=1 Tax=Fusarium oxysporum f. sp. conglutinans race 2 54008 TaxID=1089457 RepID=X0HSS9_FUSOX|nr:hypothetical protein FOPG_06587 [Fusarium oxysporum f. sp. conglutinans race 2 54008]